MTRSLGLVMLILSLAVGGYLFSQQAKTAAPGGAAQQAEAQATIAGSATSFAAAAPTLQLWFEEHGTYAGASLPPAYGVVLAKADATSYCLEAGGTHLVGPNGSAEPGPC
jgi:ABC-type phosphate transport system substrate-binding protein